MAKLDRYGRPYPPSTWGGTGLPNLGYYRIKLVRPGGLWLPARVAGEWGIDPLTGYPMARWNPVLRILDWAWWRWEMEPWQSSLHPVTQRIFEEMSERELAGDPLEPYDANRSRLAI